MKIGLYLGDGVGDGVGGAELMMAYLGSVWSRAHDVDLIHHRPELTRARLAAFSSDDLGHITLRGVPREPEPRAGGHPLARFRAARRWHRSLSDGYDLFVNCTHWLPPFSHAACSVLLVLFPYYQRPRDLPEIRRLPLWRQYRHRVYADLEWRRRLATYGRSVAISQFASTWTQRRWHVDPIVVHPPVDVDFADRLKSDTIVSVNRFNLRAHKKQLELMQAFASMKAHGFGAWSYASVGGLNATPDNREYFERVRAAGARVSGTAAANVSRAVLKGLLERSRIFWHGMGYGENTDDNPGRVEHFGIATVEAMAAGCVPVVFDGGGPAEVVEHGRTGFRWRSIDELTRYTRLLADDPALWDRMAAAAREKAREFDRTRFVDRMSEICGVPPATAPDSPRRPADDRTVLSTAQSS